MDVYGTAGLLYGFWLPAGTAVSHTDSVPREIVLVILLLLGYIHT
jgi:hypothetical protein